MLETRLGKYELLEKLGRGATADVYRATDTVLGRQVALKVIEVGLSDPAAYTEEARTLDRLRHPNIVAVHGAEIVGGRVLIDMELMAGRTLKDRLAGAGTVPVEEALTITAHLLNGLAYAHANHVLHRDIKPENVFLGDGGTVKLGDFGNARPFTTDVYHAGGGTYPYMAPEAFAGTDRFDRRSDLWSVGVVLYRMLTGRLPFLATPPADPFAWKALLDRCEKPAPLGEFRTDIPNGLPGIVGKALAFDKAQRYPDAKSFLDALKQNALYPLPNTEVERLRADRYVAAYNRIDDHLRAELGLGRTTGFADVVRAYARCHTGWTEEAYFLEAARVRNALTHGLRDASRYRPVPSPEAVTALESAAERLTGPSAQGEAAPGRIWGTSAYSDPATVPTPSEDAPPDDELTQDIRRLITAHRYGDGSAPHRAWDLCRLAVDKARAGHIREALAAAHGIPDDYDSTKVKALCGIARAQERAGDAEGCLATFAEALTLTLDMAPTNGHRVTNLASFADEYALRGDVPSALAVARCIPLEDSVGYRLGAYHRAYALSVIAHVQAKSGDADGSRATLAEVRADFAGRDERTSQERGLFFVEKAEAGQDPGGRSIRRGMRLLAFTGLWPGEADDW